jgi:hypothetical protein
MQAAMIAIVWSLVGKLGAEFVAKVLCAGMDEWAKHTETKFDDKVAEAFEKAWGVEEKPAS